MPAKGRNACSGHLSLAFVTFANIPYHLERVLIMRRAGIWLILCMFWFTSVAAGFELQSPAAILMDARTAQVIYSKNPDLRREPASTTKILTALVAVEKAADLNALVTISAKAANTEGSSAQLEAGMKIPLRELLYAMLMLSGNDAANAIAEYVAGNVATFAEMMNTRARAAGATHSNFVNPSGLPASTQYSTVRDLALIGRAALRNPVLAQIFATKQHHFAWMKAASTNHNRLLWTVPGADGVKNGYTIAAHHTWVGSATRDGLRLITAVLGAPSRTVVLEEQERLLDYGFTLYKTQESVQKGQTIGQLRVRGGEVAEVAAVAQCDAKVWVRNDQSSEVIKQVELPEDMRAPLTGNEVIGTLRYVSGGEILAEVPLVPAAPVPEAPALARVGRYVKLGGVGAVGTVGMAFAIRMYNIGCRRWRRWSRRRQARQQWRLERRRSRMRRMHGSHF